MTTAQILCEGTGALASLRPAPGEHLYEQCYHCEHMVRVRSDGTLAKHRAPARQAPVNAPQSVDEVLDGLRTNPFYADLDEDTLRRQAVRLAAARS